MADLQQPDWRIPLVNTTEPRTVEDFQKAHATIAGVQAETRNRDAEARVRNVAATEAEQALAEQQLVRRVAQETGGAWDVMLPRLRQVAPGAAAKYEQELAKTRKEMAAAAKDEADMERQSIEYASSVLRSIRTPEQYAALRPRLAAINPDLAELLPEQYDPAAIAQIQQLAIPAKDAAAANAKAAELFMQGKPMEAVGRILSVATDQEDWDEALGVARHYLPAQALAIFPREFTPEARAQATQLAMSVGERVDNERQAAAQTLTAAGQAESARHNRVMEGQGATRIADARRTAAGGGGGGAAAPLVDAIMANPALFSGLTPTDKAKLIPVLQKRGFKFDQMSGGDGKPSTGAEKTALGFFNRAKQADDELQRVEEDVAAMGLGGQLRLEGAPNFLQSSTGQAYHQAQRAFTEARLRKESGAAIADSEFANDRRMYFAQPGDSKAILEQKRRARNAVLAGLGFQAGRALGEFYGDDASGLVNDYRARAKGEAAAPSGPQQTSGTSQPTSGGKKRIVFYEKNGQMVEKP